MDDKIKPQPEVALYLTTVTAIFLHSVSSVSSPCTYQKRKNLPYMHVGAVVLDVVADVVVAGVTWVVIVAVGPAVAVVIEVVVAVVVVAVGSSSSWQ
jgi:hypothetical protein